MTKKNRKEYEKRTGNLYDWMLKTLSQLSGEKYEEADKYIKDYGGWFAKFETADNFTEADDMYYIANMYMIAGAFDAIYGISYPID